MTKAEMNQLINDTFDELIIQEPITKQQMLFEIEQIFDNLLVK